MHACIEGAAAFMPSPHTHRVQLVCARKHGQRSRGMRVLRKRRWVRSYPKIWPWCAHLT